MIDVDTVTADTWHKKAGVVLTRMSTLIPGHATHRYKGTYSVTGQD